MRVLAGSRLGQVSVGLSTARNTGLTSLRFLREPSIVILVYVVGIAFSLKYASLFLGSIISRAGRV